MEIIFLRKGSFRGINFAGENLRLGNLREFLYEFLFISLTFSFPTQFYLWKRSGELSRGNFYRFRVVRGILLLEEHFSWEELAIREFFM